MKNVLALSLILVVPLQALAWSGAGHMVIAAEAYQLLPTDEQEKVDAILKAHPDYNRWESSFTNGGSAERGLFIFMRASTWPDEIRRRGNPYDHPAWHYVDWPLKPPSFRMEPEPSPDNDVLFGVSECERVLSNTNAPATDRAAYLSWLIHLVGDIHQPLHCCSLFTNAYPNGDKGGNSFFVKPGARGVNLHTIWDGLLGTSGTPQSELKYAVAIASRFPRSALPELKTDITPRSWSLEGRTFAIEKVYLRGKLKGSTSADTAPALPEGYTKEAKAVAEKQAALAGYRLADEIAACLK